MKELIKVQNHEGKNIVSARAVWQFLEAKKQFADWIKARIIKYGLIEGQDFTTFSPNSEKGRPEIEYYLTFDTAKELAMVEGNAKGREARQYFIGCEKALYAVGKVITQAQSQALGNQKAKFEIQKELKQIKKEFAHVFKKQAELKKRLKSLENDTYIQLGMFEQVPKTIQSFSTI